MKSDIETREERATSTDAQSGRAFVHTAETLPVRDTETGTSQKLTRDVISIIQLEVKHAEKSRTRSAVGNILSWLESLGKETKVSPTTVGYLKDETPKSWCCAGFVFMQRTPSSSGGDIQLCADHMIRNDLLLPHSSFQPSSRIEMHLCIHFHIITDMEKRTHAPKAEWGCD